MEYSTTNESQKRERLKELEDLKVILQTEAGVQYFKRFFRDSYIFRPTGTLINEGMRILALKQLNDIREVAPELIQKFVEI